MRDPYQNTHSTPTAQGPVPQPAAEERHRFEFTADGAEYFRIWIVNLCLTLATLGIYSAWAKTRRLQYFYRNTQLAGAVFDFHGDSTAILKGRVFAVVLFVLYQYAFGFSETFGIAVIAFLFLSLPWMLRSALRFRLRNTSYRGVRFDFGGSITGAYVAYLPVMLMFLLPTVLFGMQPQWGNWGWIVVVLLYLVWPLLHAGVKRYQHGNLMYGASRSTYESRPGDFFASYFLAALLGFFAVAIGGVMAFLVALLAPAGTKESQWVVLGLTSGVLLLMYFVYLLSGPYLDARIHNLVWSHTGFAQLKLDAKLPTFGFIRLQLVNGILTVLTLGLFRPFAVVRTCRYRLASVALLAQQPVDALFAGQRAQAGSAGGEGAADLLGIDLSW